MKHLFLIGIFLCVTSISFAQSDVKADTLRVNPADFINLSGSPRMDRSQTYDGFLLDIKPLDLFESVQPLAQSLKALMPDFSQLLPRSTVTFGTLSGNTLLPSFSLGSYGYSYFHSVPTTGNVQVANFRLKNGITISTMGDYDANGNRVNRPVNPWQRNNFQGAFQLKSADGKFSFGIRVSNGY